MANFKLKQSASQIQDLLDKMEEQNLQFSEDDFNLSTQKTGNFITLGYNQNFYSDNSLQTMDGRIVIFEYFPIGDTEPKVVLPTSPIGGGHYYSSSKTLLHCGR